MSTNNAYFLLMNDMTEHEKTMFMFEVSKSEKSPAVALALCFFLGGLGIHHLYMGNTKRAIIYMLLCWTFLPGISALISLFFIVKEVNSYNEKVATSIAHNIKLLRKENSSLERMPKPKW